MLTRPATSILVDHQQFHAAHVEFEEKGLDLFPGASETLSITDNQMRDAIPLDIQQQIPSAGVYLSVPGSGLSQFFSEEFEADRLLPGQQRLIGTTIFRLQFHFPNHHIDCRNFLFHETLMQLPKGTVNAFA